MQSFEERHLEVVYSWTKYILFALYAVTIVGLWQEAPKYMLIVDEGFKLLVALILIYFFNPLRKTRCTEFHRRVVFSAGVFLIISSSLKSLLEMVPLLNKII